MFAVYIEQDIRYLTAQPVPVKDVVAALIAFERLAARTFPKILSEFTQQKVTAPTVLVEGVTEGSLVNTFVCRFLFPSEKAALRFVKKMRGGHVVPALKDLWRELPGGKSMTGKAVGLAVVVTLVVGAGVWWALQQGGSTPQAMLEIQGNNNVAITIGAEVFQQNPDAVKQIVDAAIGSRGARNAQDVADVLSPAKSQPSAGVDFGIGDESHELKISAVAVSDMPRDIDTPADEYDESFPDVDLQIRALDLDQTDKGWAAVIPGMIDRRVKLVLSPGIDPGKIANRMRIRADVTISYKKTADGRPAKPVQITVDEVITAPGGDEQ